MFLLRKDAKYLDVAEVALLNNVLAAVNFEGNRFFYVNPLEADGKYPFNHGTAGRAPWFGTACCSSNLARLIPQVPGMTYAHDDNDLYITFFAESRTQVEISGVRVKLEQKTAYPNDTVLRMEQSRSRIHVRLVSTRQGVRRFRSAPAAEGKHLCRDHRISHVTARYGIGNWRWQRATFLQR
jgi:DUF1680 family protein